MTADPAAGLIATLAAGLEPHQRPPAWRWKGWAMRGGRGAGKSRALTTFAVTRAHLHATMRARIIAPTRDDALNSVIHGPAGILTLDPSATFHPASVSTPDTIRWASGAEAVIVSTPTPASVDRLRATGNRSLDLWEEAAANPQLERAWPQAMLGLREGPWPQWVAATTPRPLPVVRGWDDDPEVAVTVAAMADNPHLPKSFVDQIEATYGGTALYAQEVLGHVVDSVEGALWTLGLLDRTRIDTANRDDIRRAVVGVDPAKSTGTTGIVAAAITTTGQILILEDASLTGVPAETWATRVAAVAKKWGGSIVVEDDSGGDAMRAVLQSADLDVHVETATARRVGSKQVRALPVAMLWQRDPPGASMVGSWPKLEDELCTWTPDDSRSPDRLDAMVWAVLRLIRTGRITADVPDPAPTAGAGMPAWMRGGR